MHDAVGNRNGNAAAQRATRPRRWKGRVMSEIMSLVHTVLQWRMMGMLAKGGAMMLPLLAASVTSLTVIIERGGLRASSTAARSGHRDPAIRRGWRDRTGHHHRARVLPSGGAGPVCGARLSAPRVPGGS